MTPMDQSAFSSEQNLSRARRRLYLGVPLAMGGWQLGLYLAHRHTLGTALLNTALGTVLGLAFVHLAFRVYRRWGEQMGAAYEQATWQLTASAVAAEISRSLSAKLAQEELLPYLAESLTRIVGGKGCAIFLVHTSEIRLAATWGEGIAEESPNWAHLARESMHTRQPGIFEALPAATRSSLPFDMVLALPLVAQGQPLGAALIGTQTRPDPLINQAMVVANQGAVAIANALLFQEVERRLVELGTLAELSRVLGSLLRPADIYQRAVRELGRAFGYPFIAFYFLEQGALQLGAQEGYAAGQLPARIPLGQGLIGRAAATRQMAYVLDRAASRPEELDPPYAEGVTAQIALPLYKDDQVLGVLSIEHLSPLSEADLSLLQSLSFQIATALENARLYAAERRERQIAHTLLEIASELGGTLQLDRVLDLILSRLRQVVPYTSAAIGLSAGDTCYIAAAHDLPRAERLWQSRLVPDELPFIARVLHERTPVIVADTRQEPEWAAIEGSENIRAWLGVPLVAQERTIGLLMLNHDKPGFYDQQAARLAEAFAQHAALAIENARLYQQTQAALQEQAWLHDITSRIASTLDAGQILRLLVEGLVKMLGLTSARVITIEDRQHTATVVAQHCIPSAAPLERENSVGQHYPPETLDLLAPLLAERASLTVTAEEASPEWQAFLARREGQSLLCVPLVARDRVTGFAELWDSRSPRHFTPTETALARTLINPAAAAVENARLFAETQHSINELMLLYDTAVWAASTEELDTTLQSVVKTLQFRVLEGAMVNMWLFDPLEETLHLRAYAGRVEGMPFEQTRELGARLARESVEAGQPLLLEEVQAEREGSVRSALCVPLKWQHQVNGVLQALSAQPNAFSGRDLRLLSTMAASLAIGIQNTRLITELKRSEDALTLRNRALEQANERLKELDRLKSAFVANVSHELRTPLNSIIGFSEVLMDGLAGEMSPQAQEYLSYIHRSGKDLLSLIDDILDLSRLQAGRMDLKLEPVDVTQVVQEVHATLAPLLAAKAQTFILEKPADLPIIMADSFRLKQILINLLSNANRFTPEEGQITVRLGTANSALRVDVSDTGPGIPLEEQALIFQEFRQARTARPGEGTGLGLAISRRLVELHGGRIWVESEPGHGATFTVLLPISGPTDQDEHPDTA